MELVKQASKGEVLRSQCSLELKKLLEKFEIQVMHATELYDAIRRQAIKDGLDDWALDLIIADILRPMDLSAKRKQEIRKQFRPINSKPKGLPSPSTPILPIEEIVEINLPFTLFDPDDVDEGKRILIDIIEHAKNGLWINMRKNKEEITEVKGDDYDGI